MVLAGFNDRRWVISKSNPFGKSGGGSLAPPPPTERFSYWRFRMEWFVIVSLVLNALNAVWSAFLHGKSNGAAQATKTSVTNVNPN